ncbi:hypothetical protein FTV88_2862 [Heliorestis convoluta]|uniref:Uncharacterized protein n=1 Tax=Heliorestis convoluta TaxID=356322 RepID=A0A5Q2N3Q3_9FIRM|nr:hypothetical protein FTV88_2862 [Heliorestis convoluta]
MGRGSFYSFLFLVPSHRLLVCSFFVFFIVMKKANQSVWFAFFSIFL